MKLLVFAIIVSLPVLAQQQSLPKAADYEQAAQLLKTGRPAKSAPRGKRKADIVGSIDNSIAVTRQVPLSANALLALNMSENWLVTGPTPTIGPAGRVVYPYGQGAPTVVCAVLQVCEIDLEAGETLAIDAIDWGDHRFEVVPRTAGSGSAAFTYLVLKPTEAGLDTTLTVGTSERPYYIRLVSTNHEHMARVAFSYPDEEARKLKAAQEAKLLEDQRAKAEADRLAKLNTDKPIRNWNYSVKLHGKDAAYLRPRQIGDDGVHTHVTLSEQARYRGLPIVRISDARGPIPANSHWSGNELVIDAVFEHACLLEGVGRKQQRACITNEGLQANGDH